MRGLERYFDLYQHDTTLSREVLAGVTTSLTTAYIVFVNPAIMSDAGVDRGAAFVATYLAAAIGCLLMGLLANYPIALAPGMGLNTFFTFTVVGQMGHSWQTARDGCNGSPSRSGRHPDFHYRGDRSLNVHWSQHV